MRRLVTIVGGVVGLVALAVLPTVAQQSDDVKTLQKDVEALKEGQKALKGDLQEIKNLLQQRARPAGPPPESVVNVDGAIYKGDKNAKVTLVDFTDYQ
jgi:type II secretory pathway pseudopilin PulG